MEHLKLEVTLFPQDPWGNILISELAELGFTSFETNDMGFCAYVTHEGDIKKAAEEFLSNYEGPEINWHFEVVPDQNWNERWENSFDPVTIGKKLRIRANFHQAEKAYENEILITPKMSFGTGHHPTTYLMLETLLEEGFEGKTVMDMGAGSGILSILAEYKGAKEILAIDNESWAYENMMENFSLNNCRIPVAMKGDSSALVNRRFNIILANINKNVILSDLPIYEKSLEKGGSLFLSGFYSADILDIDQVAQQARLSRKETRELEGWVMLKYNRETTA